jgi:hypothetical protein
MNEEEQSIGDKVLSEEDDGSFARRIADRVNMAVELDQSAAQQALEHSVMFPRASLDLVKWGHRWPKETLRTPFASIFSLAMSGWRGRFRVSLAYTWEDLTGAHVVEERGGTYDPTAGLLIRHMERNLNAVLSSSTEAAKRIRELLLFSTPANAELGATGMCIPSDPADEPRLSAFGCLFGGRDFPLTLCYVTDSGPDGLSSVSRRLLRAADIEKLSKFEVV